MRDGDQIQPTVVNTKKLVTLEIKPVNIFVYLLIGRSVTKPQVTI